MAALRNSLVLPLLGLLVEQPTHAYELAARLRRRYEQLPATRSTVTSLLQALERSGLVAAHLPARVGNRPPRTVYELTEAGIADFRRKVAAGLCEGQVASADFIMAVAYAAILPADHAASLLDARADRLDRELAAPHSEAEGVPEVHMLEVSYWHAVVAAEATWIRTLTRRIRSHDIDWSGRQADESERADA
ncbi:PadR family transcriptional regulator [Micromonospora sp. NPDC003197]